MAAGELTPTEAKGLADIVGAYGNARALGDAGLNYSRQAEIESAAAAFDQRLADRVRAALAMQNAAGNTGEMPEYSNPNDGNNTA